MAENAYIRSRAWIFTWNNPPDDYTSVLDGIDCRYIIGGEEVAPSTGTRHIQGYVYFREAKTVGPVRGLFAGCHVACARGSAVQNRDYCSKTREEDETPNAVVYSRGDIPMDDAGRGSSERNRWQVTRDAAQLGDLETVPADIFIRYYGNLRRIERDYMPRVNALGAPCGIWIYGRAGTGKSLSVQRQFPDHYPKPRSMWWDGYQREPVVCCDDVGKYDVRLGDRFKQWADCFPFIAENKGGSVIIRPKHFIVTSQYRIEDIWEDPETREALNRRFRIINKGCLEEEIEIVPGVAGVVQEVVAEVPSE